MADEYWDLTDPIKPVGIFDPDAELNFPFDWVEWLADIASAYASHTIICPTPLICLNSSQAGGVIVARIARDPDAAVGLPKPRSKYPVTCRIVAADGQTDDRTVYLQIIER